MPRTGISYDDVVNTARTIAADGETPTIDRIRQALGSGSYSTIARHLRAWRERTEAEPAATHTETPALPADALHSLGEAWAVLKRKAEQEIVATKEQLQQERRRMAGLLRQERRKRQAANRALSAAEVRGAHLSRRLERQGQTLTAVRRDNDALRQQLALATEHAADLRNALADANTRATEEAAERQALRTLAVAQQDALNRLSHALDVQHRTVRDRLASLERTLGEQQALRREQENRLAAAQARIDELGRELVATRESAAARAGRLAARSHRLAQLARGLREERARLAAKLATQPGVVEVLEGTLARALTPLADSVGNAQTLLQELNSRLAEAAKERHRPADND